MDKDQRAQPREDIHVPPTAQEPAAPSSEPAPHGKSDRANEAIPEIDQTADPRRRQEIGNRGPEEQPGFGQGA